MGQFTYPPEPDNLSKMRFFLCLTSLLLSFLYWGCSSIKRKPLHILSMEQMEALARPVFLDFLDSRPHLPQGQQKQLLLCVFRNLIESLDNSKLSLKWELLTLDTGEAHAIGLPGGKMIYARGLSSLANNADLVAGVMAHLMGHITLQHANERISQALAVGVGFSLSELLIHGSDRGTRMNTFLLGSLGVSGGLKYGFSREHEREADEFATQLMARAGFDPRGLRDLLHKMTYEDEKLLPEFFKLHTLSLSRLRETERQAARSLSSYRKAIKGSLNSKCW